ncbi:hypothetical protein [Paracoccus sp. PAMC 22219]|uniref:hypothetical protein n=1 Tax=Paracoccus sp. PAMC 22219 TaxID=1569209 RepID=UPI0005A8A41A|nr:hypothetical protein [Paracoccus sp. PAMC 22219]
MDIDGVKTNLPMIFVSNLAVSNQETVRELVTYYNDPERVPSPDLGTNQVTVEPLRHLRTILFSGADRRYAAEREVGSATYQTDHWTLRANGERIGETVASGAPVVSYRFDTSNHLFDQVLQSADQPPFYPAIEVARIHLTQSERLMGKVLGPKRVTFDARYIQHGIVLPEGDASLRTPQSAVPEPNAREVVLALLDKTWLKMEEKGDHSGGVFRPDAQIVALSPPKGALTLNTYTPITLVGKNDDLLPDVAQYFLTASEAAGKLPPTKGDLTDSVQDMTVDVQEEVRVLYQKLFTCESKILGLVCLPDLIKLIRRFAPPGKGVPLLNEVKQFGNAGAEAANTVREEVVLPLSGAVRRVRQEWDEIDRAIAKTLPGTDILGEGVIRVRDVFPDLFASLVELDAALARAVGTTDPVEFALELSACYAAGQRFLAAIKRAAADPKAAIDDALSAKFGELLALFKAIDQGLGPLIIGLLTKALELEGNAIADKVTKRLVAGLDSVIDTIAASVARPTLIALPVPADPNRYDCLEPLLPFKEDVGVVLKSISAAYAKEVTLAAVKHPHLPEPEPDDVLKAWLEEEEPLFGDSLFAVTREDLADAIDSAKTVIADAFPSNATLRTELQAQIDALAQIINAQATDLFEGEEEKLRRGTHAHQIRTRYLVSVILGFASDPDMLIECLPRVDPRFLHDLFDYLAKLIGSPDLDPPNLLPDLSALMDPILRMLRALAELVRTLLTTDLPGILHALGRIFGEIRLPLPNCTELEQVWNLTTGLMVKITAVAEDADLCPPDWGGPAAGRTTEAFIEDLEDVAALPGGMSASLCRFYLGGAVEAERLRQTIAKEGTSSYVGAVSAFVKKAEGISDIPIEAKTAIAQLEAGRAETVEGLAEIRDALKAGYMAVVADSAALRRTIQDMRRISTLQVCERGAIATEFLEQIQALANLPRDVQRLADRRKALMETILNNQRLLFVKLRRLDKLAEKGELTLPLMAGGTAYLLSTGLLVRDSTNTLQPPVWTEKIDTEYAALRGQIEAASEAVQALAEGIALALCTLGGQAVALIEQLTAAEADLRVGLSTLRAQAKLLPPPVRAIVERIAREADFDGALSEIGRTKDRLNQVRTILIALCDPMNVKPVALPKVTGLAALFVAKAGAPPVDLVAPATGSALLDDLVAGGYRVSRALAPVIDQIRTIVEAGPQAALLDQLGPILKLIIQDGYDLGVPTFTNGAGKTSVLSVYETLQKRRDQLLSSELVETLRLEQPFLVLPDAARQAIGTYSPALTDKALNNHNDQLAGDVAWLRAAGDGRLSAAEAGFLLKFAQEWGDVGSTPIRILHKVGDVIEDLFSGRIYKFIDFSRLREEFEDQLLALVPTKVEMSYGFEMELGSEVASATMGIFRPGPGTALGVDLKIAMDLAQIVTANGPPQVEFLSIGTLGPFDIKLVGDLFDALTLKFAAARFETRSGDKPRLDIAYIGHEIGPELKFVEKLQNYLAPKDGSGAILNFDSAIPGIESGYRLQLGDFSVGNLAFTNVGLEATAILPFSNRDAVFKASLSSRSSPFTLTYAPYGGSGFFAIYANTNGIIGFEAGFEFGGSAVFAFGPLTGQGRLMTGVYIKQQKSESGTVTDISMTFIAEGSAAIWIFHFGASLSLKMGMQDGNMTGEATFAFSFSMGLADYEYSIKMQKSEGEGFSGQQSADGRRTTQFAQLGGDLQAPTGRANSYEAIIRKDAVCQAADWRTFQTYFDEITPPQDYF